ncbi:dual specificity protein phosphatase 26 isoform X1, partial [Silurus asotus]
MPSQKMHHGTGKPCLSQTAKDGTVWVDEDIGMPSAVANHTCFTAQAGPTESAKDTRAERVKRDKFAAISDIWTSFNKNCAESFTSGEHMTIDEQLFPTKVHCPFTQYIATKPDKFGIKFWMAMDLETKYVCNASPYLGKDPSCQKGERLAGNVVMNLSHFWMMGEMSRRTISLLHCHCKRHCTARGLT